MSVPPHLKMTVTNLKITLISMSIGIFIFACLILFLILSGQMEPIMLENQSATPALEENRSTDSATPQADEPDLKTILLAILGIMILSVAAVSVVLKKIFFGNFQKQRWPEPLTEEAIKGILVIYSRWAIASAALADGVSLFAIILFMFFGMYWVLVVPFVGIVVILSKLPSEDRFNQIARDANLAGGA